MRRFIAFVMCASGLTLAVTWTRADEPAVAATSEEALSPAEAAPARPPESSHPPSRPVVIRTEPGSHQQVSGDARRPEDVGLNALAHQVQRRLDELQARRTSPEFLEQMEQRLKELRARLVNSEYSGRGLASTRKVLAEQVSRIEAALAEAGEQRAAIAAETHGEAAAEHSSGDRPDPDEERRPDVSREMRRRGPARNAVAERVETRLQQLQELASELLESGTEEAEVARREIEQQIDKLERYLAERRERRDAAERHDRATAEHHAADDNLQRRLRHIGAAIEHLEAAGLADVADSLRKQVQEMQTSEMQLRRNIQARERALAQQERAMAEAETARVRAEEQRRKAARDADAGRDGVNELAEQLGDLRRELRQLRGEVQELRELKAQPKIRELQAQPNGE